MTATKCNSSEQYWKSQAFIFSNLYKKNNHFSTPTSLVSLFLHKRTKLLYELMPQTMSKTILDVGCGSGIHMAYYSPFCRSIIGVDYSKQMLDEANRNLKKCVKNNWKLILSDVSHIPLTSDTVDIAFAMGLIDYVQNPKDVCMEIHRLLKPKGVCIVSIPKNPSIFSILRTPIGNWIKKSIFHLPKIDNAMSEKTITELLHSAGFSIDRITNVWGAMWIIKAIKK